MEQAQFDIGVGNAVRRADVVPEIGGRVVVAVFNHLSRLLLLFFAQRRRGLLML